MFEEPWQVDEKTSDEDDAHREPSSFVSTAAGSSAIHQQRDVLMRVERMTDGQVATERHGHRDPGVPP